jgi:type I restriction enzyme, S subunit
MSNDQVSLSCLAEAVVAGFWGDDQSSVQSRRSGFVIQNGDVRKDGWIISHSLKQRCFSDRQMDKAKVDSQDIILVSSGAYTGNTGRIKSLDNAKEYIASNFVRRVRPKKEVDPEWLFQLLQSEIFTRQLHKFIGGSAMPNLQSDFAERCKFDFVPHNNERKIIGCILRALDAKIEATEGLISKQQRVRAGLMQDLFTRGVDEHGQLRPPRDEAPQLYHQTEFGWLPLGWEAPELESLLASVPTPMRSGPFGSALLKHELVDTGVPFLGIDNIHVEHFKADFIRFVTPRKFSELSRYRVLPNDVVITIMGTVGRSCVIPDGFGEMLSSKHLWTMSFDQSKVLPKLVCWQLNHAPWVHSWFRANSQGGIMDAIQSSTLKQMRLPKPLFPEQQKILAIYEEATSHLRRMREECAKLRLQKSGLMQDLLTGTVSVAPLLQQGAA